MSKDIPVIFSAPMVRALLDGSKTQTRRILNCKMPAAPAIDNVLPKNVARHDLPYFDAYCGERKTPENPRGMSPNWCWWTRDDRQCLPTVNVKYAPGDRLWVREGWKPHSIYAGMKPRDMPRANVFYLSDQTYEPSGVRGLPSIHMPRWASRLTLIVTGVKVERLDDISHADAIAEGCKVINDHCYVFGGTRYDEAELCHSSPVTAFSCLWSELHGDESWEKNPFVVAVTFRVIKANVDAPEARAAT